MKRRVLWLLFAYLVSIVFLTTSCNSSTVTTTTTTKTVVPTTKNQTTTTQAEEPQYGGTLTFITADTGVFDYVAMGQMGGPAKQLVVDRYLEEDWTRGAAGSGEINWVPNISPAPDTCMGILAESWQIPALGTVVYQVRRGVHWAYNPESEASRLMNGREVTADDWIASFDYIMNPHSGIKLYIPQLFGTATMDKTGPWEVTLKTPVDPLVGWNWLAMSDLFPPEVIAKYGNMQDWQHVVGTGPFILTDYVPESSVSLTRNPEYWMKDPVGPGEGNQLPYLGGVKILVVNDISTSAAALRTGKADFFTVIPADDANNYVHEVSEVRYTTYVSSYPYVIAMRIDKTELPYKEKKVRQALMMATDFNALKDGFYGGSAEILGFPVSSEAKGAYMPLDQMPESAQALYRYNPEKARELLAEAEYPDGFTARMILWSAFDYTDIASVLQDMWAKAGIKLELQPKESGVFGSIAYSWSYQDMILCPMIWGSQYPTCLNLMSFKSPCFGYVSDPVIEAAFREIQKHVIIDMSEANRLFRELMPYLVEQAYYLPLPSTLASSLWWPWLKNYHGETPIGFAKYWWIDRDMKEEMTGRR
jgi:peptide/nickel transport system substrate-binding protein